LQALRNQNDVLTLPTSRGLRFDKHTAKYHNKNLQELC
jgi:hypothetical protein